MGSLVIGTIIDRARRTLLELKVGEASASDVRWDRTRELLPLANAAQKAICIHKPSAYVKNTSLSLASGAKQSVPSDGTAVADVQHNLGSDGSTVGRAITIVDRATLTAIDPTWMTATGSAVEHYVYDQRDPKVFFVYPRPSGAWYVSLAYPAIPADIASGAIDSGAISVDDVYDTAIHDFIVGYALLKNSKSGDTGKSAFYLDRFERMTGIAIQRQQAFQPLDQPAQVQAPDALGKA